MVVIGLPLGTLIAWHRHAQDAEVRFSEDQSRTQKLQREFFRRGDFEFKYYWMRLAGWAVLVLVAILEQFCPVRRLFKRCTASNFERLHGW